MHRGNCVFRKPCPSYGAIRNRESAHVATPGGGYERPFAERRRIRGIYQTNKSNQFFVVDSRFEVNWHALRFQITCSCCTAAAGLQAIQYQAGQPLSRRQADVHNEVTPSATEHCTLLLHQQACGTAQPGTAGSISPAHQDYMLSIPGTYPAVLTVLTVLARCTGQLACRRWSRWTIQR
jgi:hypothetical protein